MKRDSQHPGAWLLPCLVCLHVCYIFLPCLFKLAPASSAHPDTHLPKGMLATVSACDLRIVCFVAQRGAASTCCKSLRTSPCLLSQINVQSI